MLEIAIAAVGLISIGLIAALARRVSELERQLHLALTEPPAALQLPEPETQKPLEGLRVRIVVEQDHPQPVFAGLLKEQFEAEDAEITDDAPDLTIQGQIVCNGYSDIYYSADLRCTSGDRTILTFSQKPPHGDRPQNLAIEIVAGLKSELKKLVERSERQRALRELRL
jgi:hypothetical protein